MLHPCRGADATTYLNNINAMVASATQHGMKVQLVLTGVAAGWGVPRGCAAPYNTPTGVNPNIANYKAFVTKYVLHFNQLGVKRFSLWNEPNLASFLCPKVTTVTVPNDVDLVKCSSPTATAAKLFIKLYKAGYNVIQGLKKAKKISQDVKILFGEFAGFHPTFVNAALKGQKLKADGFSYHPYQYCSPPTTMKKTFPVATCKRLMSGMGWTKNAQTALQKWAKSGQLRTPKGGVVPLYLTEFGYHVQGKYAMPETYRSKWYPQALEFARKNRVQGFVMYQFGPSPVVNPPLWDTSILDVNLAPTATYISIWTWAKSRSYKVLPY